MITKSNAKPAVAPGMALTMLAAEGRFLVLAPPEIVIVTRPFNIDEAGMAAVEFARSSGVSCME